MDEELNAFFDEVSAVEAEAKEATEPESNGELDSRSDSTKSLRRSEAVDGNIDKTSGAGGDEDEQQPTAKRPKLNHQQPPRPKGVVLVAAAAVARSNPAKGSSGANQGVAATLYSPQHQPAFQPLQLQPIAPIPPPPPPPPLPQHQYQQQQQAGAGAAAPPPPGNGKPHVRMAAGKVWVDPTLADWPENDFRLFVGNLSNEVSDQQLMDHFAKKYASVQRARVVRDAGNNQSKGYGFVSLLDAKECARAIREMDQSWLTSRPIRVKRSHWKDREWKNVQKQKKKQSQQRKRTFVV